MFQASKIEETNSRQVTHVNRQLLVVSYNRFFGLVNRKERWGLSWKGWLLVLALLIGLAMEFVYGVYPFLAVTQRVNPTCW